LGSRKRRVHENAKQTSIGTNSRSNCNCFGATSETKIVLPVTFPPGRWSRRWVGRN
jgi:hypothetical protein